MIDNKTNIDVVKYMHEYLTVKDVCNELKISIATAYKLFNTDGFPCNSIGNKHFIIRRDNLYNWADRYKGRKFTI